MPEAGLVWDVLDFAVPLSGFVGIYICATEWHRHRALHLAPFAWAVLLEIYIRIRHDNFDEFAWINPPIVGAFLYGLGWLIVWQERSDEKKRQAIAAAHPPLISEPIRREIESDLRAASGNRFTGLHVELNDDSNAVLVAADLPDGSSERDIASIGTLIKSTLEKKLSADHGSWSVFLNRSGRVVYSIVSEAQPPR
jgi:hypothetical protein